MEDDKNKWIFPVAMLALAGLIVIGGMVAFMVTKIVPVAGGP